MIWIWTGTLTWSMSGTWIGCNGGGSWTGSGSCSLSGCDSACGAGDWLSDSCFCVRNPRICAVGLLCARTWSPEVGRTGPSAPGARARRAARRPSRPWRLRRRACRGTAQRQSRGSPSCTCRGECTRLPRGRISQKRGGGSPVKFGKSGCPLLRRSSPPRLAAAFRNSCSPSGTNRAAQPRKARRSYAQPNAQLNL